MSEPSLPDGVRRLFRLGHPRRDVDEEMRHHLALRAEQLRGEGLSAEAAAQEARRQFAQSDATLRAVYTTADERHQHMRLREQWESWSGDIRYVLRRLLREPMISGFIVLTLALGIGANLTAFSLIDRLLLRGPEHLVEADRLVRVYRRIGEPPQGEQTLPILPFSTFQALRDGARSLTGVSAYRVDDWMVGTGEASRKMRVGRSSGGFFALLGVHPLQGRFFVPTEDALDAGPLAIVSEEVWRTQFAGDPSALGKTILIRDVPHTIVGVAPRGFTGPELGRVDIWTLLNSQQARTQNWRIVGRLPRDGSVSAASREVQVILQRNLQTSPAWLRKATLLTAPIRADDNARASSESIMARSLAAVSAIILLITCANVINLLLARIARRRRELAIRVALGAGRRRVIRLLWLEGGVLAVASAAASVLVTMLAEPLVRNALFPGGGWTFSFTDGRMIGAVLVITLLTTLLVGVVPALQAHTNRLSSALRGGARGGDNRSRLRSALTVLQAALSVVLLVGAGLFVRSLAKIRAVDLGLQPDRVVTLTAQYPRNGEDPFAKETFERERRRHRALLDAARRVAGVEHAALSLGLPFDGSFGLSLYVDGLDSIPKLPGGGPYFQVVSDDYFATMGTRLISGRAFTSADGEGSPPVAVISAAMARTLWPGQEAIGRCLRAGERAAPCITVIGVVGDVHRNNLREEQAMQYYIPMGQEHGVGGTWILVRPRGEAAKIIPAVRRALIAADPEITAIDSRVLSAALDQEMRPFRLGMVTFGLSGALALIVAALGLYSLMAYMVVWRTHEMGVRLALGATPSQIMRLVIGGGTLLALIGIAIGLVLAFLGRRWIQAQLFDVSGSDPLVFAGVAGVLVSVALLAGWLPARRAARISPTEALRAD